MMPAKLGTPGLLKKAKFWNKRYYCIISVSVNYVTNKVLSRYSNYVVNGFVWAKFGGNSSISRREVL